MRDLFDALIRDGRVGIQRLVTDRHQESVELEFKTKDDGTKGSIGKQDRYYLGKTLSAFANSAGGLLVWGVDAREKNDGDSSSKRF